MRWYAASIGIAATLLAVDPRAGWADDVGDHSHRDRARHNPWQHRHRAFPTDVLLLPPPICAPSFWFGPLQPYPYAYPPVFLPPEPIYGPLATRQFLGMPVQPRITLPRPDEVEEEPKPGRSTSAESIASGWRFIGYGDKLFLAQDYGQARLRYKQAGSVAPTLGAAFFRQAYTLIALGNYSEAAKLIKRGLKVDPSWPESGFTNDQIYGDNRMAKMAHIDALAAATVNEPHNADLLFLIGVHLFFEGEPERAKTFFERAGRLAGGEDAHLRPFFAAMEPKNL